MRSDQKNKISVTLLIVLGKEMAKADKTKSASKKKSSKAATVKNRTPVVSKKKSPGGTKSATKKSAQTAVLSKKATKTKPTASKALASKNVAKKIVTLSKRETTSAKKTQNEKSGRTTERKLVPMEELRAMLLERRNDILKNFEQDLAEKGDLPELVGDVADIAQGASENEFTFQIAEAESRELGQIDKTLEKISEGTYGVCELCGENISLARLKALPFANKCIRCQEADERGMGF